MADRESGPVLKFVAGVVANATIVLLGDVFGFWVGLAVIVAAMLLIRGGIYVGRREAAGG